MIRFPKTFNFGEVYRYGVLEAEISQIKDHSYITPIGFQSAKKYVMPIKVSLTLALLSNRNSGLIIFQMLRYPGHFYAVVINKRWMFKLTNGRPSQHPT
jgi:hypothetical protein